MINNEVYKQIGSCKKTKVLEEIWVFLTFIEGLFEIIQTNIETTI
jgi:hypothetical protein